MKGEIMQLKKKVEATYHYNDVKTVLCNVVLTAYRYIIRYVFCNIARYCPVIRNVEKFVLKKIWWRFLELW